MLKLWYHIEKFLSLSRCETGRGLYELDVPIRAQADGHNMGSVCCLDVRLHTLQISHSPWYRLSFTIVLLLAKLWDKSFWHTRDRLQLQGRHVTIGFQCSSLFNDWQPKFWYRASKESVHFGHQWFIRLIIGLLWMLTIKLSKSLHKQVKLLVKLGSQSWLRIFPTSF